jgi:hypothetical protein
VSAFLAQVRVISRLSCLPFTTAKTTANTALQQENKESQSDSEIIFF